MPKTKLIFICNNCGYENPKWAGKCPACDSWNSFEQTLPKMFATKTNRQKSQNMPVILSEVEGHENSCIVTGIEEFDRVLGGGIFEASVILIAGDPGIGKSTLLLQVIGKLKKIAIPVLYVSGEESLTQVKNRAQRLGLGEHEISVLVETSLENILEQIADNPYKVVVIDSIQSIFSEEIPNPPGNIAQVRECSFRLLRLAKENNFSIFLIGHITKEGGIAGPKLLEHMVDVVINFEGDSYHQYRILRSLKNRLGRTNEVGIFVMEQEGLREVDNPSQIFLSRHLKSPAGTSAVCSFEGSRPILAEVQALVSRSNYGVPQRTVSGIDQPRLALILAILERHCGVNFGLNDVFIKVAGGLRIIDPAIDLGIATAIYSSFKNEPLMEKSVYIGEIGLSGDIRPVPQIDRRIEEAVKLGYKNLFMPEVKNQDIKNIARTSYHPVHLKHISDLIKP
jgi:DNA repair protein RadA/Sms